LFVCLFSIEKKNNNHHHLAMSLILLSIFESLSTQTLKQCLLKDDCRQEIIITLIVCLTTMLFLNSAINCGGLTKKGAANQRKQRDQMAVEQTIAMNNKSNKIWNFDKSSEATAPKFTHPVSIALTGARGMVGSGVIQTLINGGICKHIVMLDRLKEDVNFTQAQKETLSKHNVHLYYVECDITDRQGLLDPKGIVQTTLKQANVQAMLHIAALVGPFFPTPAYLSVNYDGTVNVIDCCQAANIGALIDCSSPSTRFDGSDIRGSNEKEIWNSLGQKYQGLHEYARTKALGEAAVLKAALDTNLSTCAVAPHQVYGPSDQLFLPALLRNAKSGKLRVMGDGNNCVSFTHETNIAHALLLAAGALVAHENWKQEGEPIDNSELSVLGQAGKKVNGEYMVVTDSTDEYPAGMAINFWDAIDDACAQTGIAPIRSGTRGLCRLPYWGLLVPIAYCGKLFTCLTGKFINITPFTIKMLVIDRYFDIGKAKTLLGYKPLVSFNDAGGWRAAIDSVKQRLDEEGW